MQDDHEQFGERVGSFRNATTDNERNQALRDVIEDHQHAIRRLCEKKLPPHEADEAVAATFEAACRGLPDLKKPRAIRAWLMTVAKRECDKRLRSKYRDSSSRTTTEWDKIVAPREHVESTSHDAVADWLKQISASLPAEDPRLHDLYFRQGFKGESLAGKLGVPVGRATKMVHLHKKALAAALDAEIVTRQQAAGKAPVRCAALDGLLRSAQYDANKFEFGVLPEALRDAVVDHISKCAGPCQSNRDHGRQKYRRGLFPLLFVELPMDRFVEHTPVSRRVSGRSRLTASTVTRHPVGWIACISVAIVLALLAVSSSVYPSVKTSPVAAATSAESHATSDRSGPATGSGPTLSAGPGGLVRENPSTTSAPSTSGEPPTTGPEPAPGTAPLVTPPPSGVLEVSPKLIDVPTYATRVSLGLTAGSEMSWQARGTDPAITVSPSTGTARTTTTQLNVTVNRTTTSAAAAVVVFTTSTGQALTVPIRWQAPGTVGVSTSQLSLGNRGATATFDLTASAGILTWETASPHPAITVTPAHGSLTSGARIAVTVRLTRPIATGGTVPLRVTTPDGQQKSVTVSWQATPGTLWTDRSNVHIDASVSSTSFNVGIANGSNTWTAALSAPTCPAPTCRLSINPTSGAGNAVITVTLWPHPTSIDPGAHGQATITLTTPDGQRIVVTVTWDPYEPG